MTSGGTSGSAVVLLLHGLGATGAVWQGVERELARHKGVTTFAPDLAGHGSSSADAPYTLEKLAARVARDIPRHQRLFVVGHSLGGYVALALAGGEFGIQPSGAMSIGAKLSFSESERARGADLASKPVRWFTTRAEAEERYRLVSGLPAARFPEVCCIERGVAAGENGFRLAADPAVFGIVVPSFTQLLESARCPVRILRGERDALVSREECVALGLRAEELQGLGHNAQVEDPGRVAKIIGEHYLGEWNDC